MTFRTPPGVGFYRMFDYPAGRYSDKLAVADDSGRATFSEIDARAARLAARLLALGVGPGDRAAVILPNGVPFIVAECAIMRAGLVKVPLNIRFHAKEVIYSLRDCAPAVVICTPAYAREIRAAAGELARLKAIIVVGDAVEGCVTMEAAIAEGGPSVAPAEYDDDQIVLIRYTGGTTGRPKGIVHTARSYAHIVEDVIREFALVEGDCALHLGHLSHGLNFMWPAYYAVGARQVLRENFDPKTVWRDFAAWPITWVYMVPTMIHMLLEEDDASVDTAALRRFVYASAPMPVPLLKRAIARFGPIFEQVYTLSEAPVITTMLRAEEHVADETALGSIGREVRSMALRLVDDHGALVADGEVGEIAVRSINNMAGYWNLPEETAKTLVDGWVRTGDMARRGADGFLYLADRKKDIIITGGFNVYPKEVEDVLLSHPAVAQAAVVGVADEKWGEVVKAYIVARPGARIAESDLTALCRDNLADYKKPRLYAFIDEMPLTPVGKISRAALRRRAKEQERS